MPNTQIVVSAKDLASGVFNKIKGSSDGLVAKVIALKASFEGLISIRETMSGFLTTASEFETLATSFETVTGSSESAEAATRWIQDFTKRTPYELQEVSNGFRRLAAYGLDPTRFLKPLGDTASAMGNTLSGAVEMFADAAQGEFERLKEFGVRASQQGDKVTFRWSQNGQQMVREAKKTQKGITTALGEIFSRFDGDMDKQSTKWEGMMSNAKDYWTQFKKMTMESGPFDIMKKGLKEFLDYLKTNEGRMNMARWAATTAKVVVGSFKAMVLGAKGFLDMIDYVHGGLLALNFASAKTSLLLTKMNPANLLPDSTALGKANTRRQVLLEEEIRSSAAQMLILKTHIKGRKKEFVPLLAMLDEAKNAVSDTKLLAGMNVKGSTFNFAGGSGGDDDGDGPTKAQQKASADRLKLEQDFNVKIAKLNMNRFEFARWELEREVKATKAKIGRILDAEKLGEGERLALKNKMLGQLGEYQKGALAKIGKEQKEQAAKIAKDLAEKNKQSMEEMKESAREALATSDDVFAGMTLGFAEYNDSMKATGRATADIVKQNLESSTESIRSFLHGQKLEISSIVDSIVADFERLFIKQTIMQPASNMFSGVVSSFMGGGFPGFDTGGISYGPQLAWVSEGAYSAEAHVPLPDGRSIPVTMSGGGGTTVVEPRIIVNNNASDRVQVDAKRNQAGEIEINIGAVAQNIMSDGDVTKAIASKFGLMEAF